MKTKILIVDDEADIRALTAGILNDQGFETCEADGSTSALKKIETLYPSIVLLDIWLQGSKIDGLGILKIIKVQFPAIPVLIMSGHGNIETAVQAIKDGAYDFIEKPFKSERLLILVRRIMESERLRQENEQLRLQAGKSNKFLGSSLPIRNLKNEIKRVAPSNSRVFISGPPGSGKEVIARQIHLSSKRSEKSFVVVNCAIIAPENVEQIFFGSEKEGIEGNLIINSGTFEQANGGTLFLDEVADMPLETQGKIIRVLQDQEFQRVGGSKPLNVDLRIIAATTKDMTVEINQGKFREDLFYRLNVVPVTVPPLCQRPDDIPLLSKFFMEQAAIYTGQPQRQIGDDAVAALQAYTWPGNVRELKNIIERLLIMAPGKTQQLIGVSMLPPEISVEIPVSRPTEENDEIMSLSLRDARVVFERQYLNAQISRFGGNISKTADFVGMERSALHRKLKSLRI